MESVTLPTIALRKLPGMNIMVNAAPDLAATKKVVAEKSADNPTGYVVIAAGDFDAKVHKEYTGPDFDPVAYAAELEAAQAKADADKAEKTV